MHLMVRAWRRLSCGEGDGSTLKVRGDDGRKENEFSTAFLEVLSAIRKEVMQLFEAFQLKYALVHSLNPMLVVLVPNKGGTDDVKAFRPINLMRSL